MAEAKKSSYKFCLVPKCKNTTKSTPDKMFFRVPNGAKIRKQWCNIMRRTNVSAISCLYCCEDHFDVKEDTENYMEHQIWKEQGVECRLRLKKGVLPHLFSCQNRTKRQPIKRQGMVKRERLALVSEALAEYAIKNNSVENVEEENECACDTVEAGPSTSKSELCVDCQSETLQLKSDKCVQVNIKPKYRSKGVNVNIRTEKKNVALSPFHPSSHNIGISPIKSSGFNSIFFIDKPTDSTSISSSFAPVTSTDYESHSSFNELSSEQDDSEDEKHFKNVMCTNMAIEEEPKMLLGLP